MAHAREITFPDIHGEPITEVWWFGLTQEETVKLEMSEDGGLTGYLEKIAHTDKKGNLVVANGREIMRIFREMIAMTVGRRVERNGRELFEKNEEIKAEFMDTEAYSVLFMDLVTNTESAVSFVNGIKPADYEELVKKAQAMKKAEAQEESAAVDDAPDWVKEGRLPTDTELQGASREHLLLAMRRRTQQAEQSSQ